jgi:hypothetical protein
VRKDGSFLKSADVAAPSEAVPRDVASDKGSDAAAAPQLARAAPLKPMPSKPQPPKLKKEPSFGKSRVEASILSAEVSAAVHAAAQAAFECALGEGLSTESASTVHASAIRAATIVLDPTTCQDALLNTEERPMAERIENALARAVKQSAVRTRRRDRTKRSGRL